MFAATGQFGCKTDFLSIQDFSAAGAAAVKADFEKHLELDCTVVAAVASRISLHPNPDADQSHGPHLRHLSNLANGQRLK
jgi:hypothetical protein